MEENYWTAHGLNGVSLFLSRDPRAGAWQAMARRWLFAACAAPQDARDLGLVGESTARALTGKTVTTLPDYWAENHGMVHPSYTAAGVRSLLTDGVLYQLHGTPREALPPELFWNRRRIYENLKALTDGGGYVLAPQGMDWHYLPATGDEAPHAVAALFFDDADARRPAAPGPAPRRAAPAGQRGAPLQRRPRRPRPRRAGPHDHARGLHLPRGGALPAAPRDGPRPRAGSRGRARPGACAGVRHFPHAGFVHHRHPRGQTSLSWRNSIMALPLTREGILTVAPPSELVPGPARGRRRPAEPAPAEREGARVRPTPSPPPSSSHRCQETLRQEVLFASLADGRALTFERFVALADVTVEALDQGFLRIVNEHFPLLAPNCRGSRTLYSPQGATEYRGWIGESEADDVLADTWTPPRG